MMKLIFWLRDQDSNLGPRGYEPRELPLLHPATMGAYYVIKQGWYCQTFIIYDEWVKLC